jgi:phage-related tail fiber protein
MYKTILTKYGLARTAAAETSGAVINITAVAIGDGAGNATTPDADQTQLVRELFRTAPNRVYQDPKNPLLYTIEMLIPAIKGGFTIREMAAFDDHGGMFTVANVPATYKPLGDGSEGSYSDSVIRMQFLATNANVVTLSIDPNVALATQQWALNAITIPYLLPGGSTGQVLKKVSNTDGDTEWADPSVANAVVSTIEEMQTLAANQTAVILTACTTVGLAIYIGGARLLPTEWTASTTDLTKLTLAKSYAAGTKADFVQNEPGASQALLQSRNLADLQSAATARSNLSVYSKEETDTKAPAGLIAHFARTTAPTGWFKANGAAVSRTAYATLYAAIGTTFGKGDGFNTFNLPDLRGEFLRGWDDSRGLDSGRDIGSVQTGQNASHTHAATADTQGKHDHGGVTSSGGKHSHVVPWGANGGPTPWGAYSINNQLGTNQGIDNDNTWPYTSPEADHNHTIPAAGDHSHNISVSASGGTETRPRNVSMLACIKY